MGSSLGRRKGCFCVLSRAPPSLSLALLVAALSRLTFPFSVPFMSLHLNVRGMRYSRLKAPLSRERVVRVSPSVFPHYSSRFDLSFFFRRSPPRSVSSIYVVGFLLACACENVYSLTFHRKSIVISRDKLIFVVYCLSLVGAIFGLSFVIASLFVSENKVGRPYDTLLSHVVRDYFIANSTRN